MLHTGNIIWTTCTCGETKLQGRDSSAPLLLKVNFNSLTPRYKNENSEDGMFPKLALSTPRAYLGVDIQAEAEVDDIAESSAFVCLTLLL